MKRSTYLLLALLLVLGAIVLFVLPSSQERESSDAAPPLSLVIDSAAVAKIEIQRPAQSLSLENVGGKWMVIAGASYPADPAAVQQLLSGLGRLKVGSHISSNPERQHIFQVDSSGTRIAVTERSGKSTAFIIGKMGPSFSEAYLRLPASKDVYLAEGLETWSLNKEVKDWRDHTVLSLPSETISGLKYLVGGKAYDFHRDSTTWTSGGETVETSVLNPPLTALARLRADSFIDTALRVQTNPLSVSVEGPQNVSLNFFPVLPDSAVYYVQASNSAQWFVVNKTTAHQIFAPAALPALKAAPAEAHHVAPPPPAKKTSAPPQTKKTVAKSTQQTPPAAPPAAPPTVRDTARTQATTPTTKQDAARSGAPSRSAPLGTRAKGSPLKVPPAETTKPVQETKPAPVTKPATISPPAGEKAAPAPAAGNAEDEGDLTVHTVKKGETMQSIALQYNVTVDQIVKWNLLKSVFVKPGQELYIFQKKK